MSKGTILRSYFRCKCIFEELNKIAATQPGVLSNYIFYGDTTCMDEYHWRKNDVNIRQD